MFRESNKMVPDDVSSLYSLSDKQLISMALLMFANWVETGNVNFSTEKILEDMKAFGCVETGALLIQSYVRPKNLSDSERRFVNRLRTMSKVPKKEKTVIHEDWGFEDWIEESKSSNWTEPRLISIKGNSEFNRRVFRKVSENSIAGEKANMSFKFTSALIHSD